MAQNEFNDGDELSVVRSTINGNATDAESRLSNLEFSIQQVVFVSKGGNDSNGGLSVAGAKLTIGAAITTASGMTPTSANQITVQIIDSAVYTEDFSLPEWVHLSGALATINGKADISNNCILKARRLENTTGTGVYCVRKNDSGGLAKVQADIMIVGSGNEGIRANGGQIGLTIDTIVVDGGEGLLAKSGSRLAFTVQFMSLSNSADGITTKSVGGAANSFYGNILRVEDDGTCCLIKTKVDGDNLQIQGGSFIVNELYNLGINSILNIFVNDSAGAKVADPTAQVNILNVSGDSNLEGNLNVEGLITGPSIPGQVVVKQLSDLAVYLVTGTYELPEGRYLFDADIDFGTADIALVDMDGVYVFDSTAIHTLTYSGTTPFIHAPTTGTVLQAKDFFITTPNATAIQLINGNSLIMSLIVFVNCKKVADLQDNGFLSVFDALPMVDCEDGITCHNIGVTTLNRPQWNAGKNLSGVAFRFTGASSLRGVIASVEALCDTTEAFIMVDGTYGGEMTINGGVISAGDFWAVGSRDQQDASLTSFHVIGAPDSRFIGSASVQDNTTVTTIGSTDVFVDFNLNSLAMPGENIERWSLTDTNTAELTCNVDGFAGTLNATLSTVGAGGASEYHFRATKNGVQINGVIANELGNNMAATSLSVPVTAESGDVIILQVANHDNTSNITIRYMDININ